MKPEWSGANFLRREQNAEGARKVEIVRNLALHCRFLIKIWGISRPAAKEFPRAPKGSQRVLPKRSQKSSRNVYIVTFRAFWNLPTLYRIPKSISIEQERSVCGILGTFLAGPNRAPRPRGPAGEASPKKCKTERSCSIEIDFEKF